MMNINHIIINPTPGEDDDRLREFRRRTYFMMFRAMVVGTVAGLGVSTFVTYLGIPKLVNKFFGRDVLYTTYWWQSFSRLLNSTRIHVLE